MANINFPALQADGTTETPIPVLDFGRQDAAASKSLALSNEDKAVLDSLATKLDTVAGYIDTLETLIASTNTKLDTLAGHVDAVETKLDGIDSSVDAVTSAINSGVSTSIPAGVNMIGHVGGTDMEAVAASQTDQMCGSTGAAGDYLAGVLIIPATTSPGAVSIEDGSTNTTIFTGGASSVTNLVPFFVPLGIKSASGGWEITTGANVSVIAVGDFT